MDNKIKQYEMLRQEILQYLEEYQTVRNMMYLITVTLLGFCLGKENTIIYAYLLPLLVILPSYIVAYDYWKGVTKACTYLRVFHEIEENCPFHWETRQYNFSKICYFTPKSDYMQLPYALCSFTCVLLYFYQVIKQSEYFWNEIAIGVAAIAISIFVFAKYREVDYEKYMETWRTLKRNEKAEDEENKEKCMEFINNMPEEVKQKLFKEMLQKTKEE